MPPATEFDPEARAAFQRWASTARGLESRPGRVHYPGVTDDCDCPLSSVIQGYLGVDLRVVRETAAMTCLVNGLCTPRLAEIIFDTRYQRPCADGRLGASALVSQIYDE